MSVTAEQASALQAKYAKKRKAWRRDNNLPTPKVSAGELKKK